MLTRALLAPGDEVVASDPSYLIIHRFIELSGAKTKNLDIYAPPYHLTADRVQEAIGPKTRMILLIDPLNPLGSGYPESEVRAIAEIAHDRKLWLVNDITYRDFADHTPRVPLRPGADADRLVGLQELRPRRAPTRRADRSAGPGRETDHPLQHERSRRQHPRPGGRPRGPADQARLVRRRSVGHPGEPDPDPRGVEKLPGVLAAGLPVAGEHVRDRCRRGRITPEALQQRTAREARGLPARGELPLSQIRRAIHPGLLLEPAVGHRPIRRRRSRPPSRRCGRRPGHRSRRPRSGRSTGSAPTSTTTWERPGP